MTPGASYTSLDYLFDSQPEQVRESYVDTFSLGIQGFGIGPYGYAQRPWWSASGTGNDRKGGRQLPLVWSELDLRAFRLVARDLDSRNQFAIGFLNLLVAYHVHKGYGWQVCLKGTRKTAYPTAVSNDPLVAKAQSILDTWRDYTRWPLKSREAFRRWRRDGEVFGRFTFTGWSRLPEFRFVDPELIASPTGDTDGPDSFGIRTDPDDVLDVIALHVLDPQDPTRGRWVDASEFVWAKANVDSNVKRGYTDFLPLAEQFDGCRRLLHGMLTSTVRQARTAWLEKMPGATLEQARGIVPYVAGRTTPNSATNQIDPWEGYRGYGYEPPEPPGSVKRVEGDREFIPTPAGAAGSYVDALQASLRGCCVRWGLPEFATSDASNNNFASALVANSPFTRQVEGVQYEWGACWERPIALKILEMATEAGYLSRDELRRLDVEVVEPQVASAEPDKDAATNNTLHQAGVLSATTWQLKLGLDPQHEAENFASEKKASQPDTGGGDALGQLFGSESRGIRESGFTGVDANGHHWQNGKQVKANQTGGDGGSNSSWLKSLTPSESNGVDAWTRDLKKVKAFRAMSAGKELQVRGKDSPSGFTPEQIDQLKSEFAGFKSAIDKAPNFEGTVNRVMHNIPPDTFQVGKEFTVDSYTSTAHGTSQLQTYLDNGDPDDAGHPVSMVMKLKTGADISGISSTDEGKWDEVIIRPGTRFKTTSVEPVTLSVAGVKKQGYRVTVQEIDAIAQHHKLSNSESRGIKAVTLDRVLSENGFTGTLTDKAGHKITYQDGKRVAGHHDQGGSDHEPGSGREAGDAYLAKLLAEIPGHAEREAAKGFVGKAADRVNKFLMGDSNAAKLARIGATVIDAAITTPEDVAKQPWLAGKFGVSGDVSQDIVGANTNDMLGVGIPGHLAAKLAATVLCAAWRAAKKKFGLSESADDATSAAAEFIATMLNAICDGLNLPETKPEDVAKTLKGN